MNLNSVEPKLRMRFEKILREYNALKHGENVDPSVLEEQTRSFVNAVQSKEEDYENLRREAEDILIDLIFTIEEGRCSPPKAKSVKR